MEPITAMAIMGGVSAAGGLLNYFVQQGFNEQQAEQFQRLYESAKAIVPPELAVPEYDKYQAQRPYEVEGYAPQMLGASEEGALGLDEATRSRQMSVLDQLEQMYKSGGLDPQSAAAMNQAQMQANQNAQAQRAGIEAQALRSGKGNSNLQYLLQQQAGQADANRLNQASLDAAAQSRQRALEAMGMFSNQASNLRQQDFSQQQQAAQAKDIYSKFNTNMMNDALKYKVQQENQKNRDMFENQQNILNRNVEQANAAKDLKNKLAQNAFQNQLEKQKLMTGAVGGNVQAQQSQANLSSKGIGGITGALSGAAQNFGEYSLKNKALSPQPSMPEMSFGRSLPDEEDIPSEFSTYNFRKGNFNA